MSRYFARDGSPITLEKWSTTLTPEQQRVAEEVVGDYWVSTIWLGLNHRFGDGPPLIFETMVFHRPGGEITDWNEKWSDRYSTEDEAIAGHVHAVAALRNGTLELYE